MFSNGRKTIGLFIFNPQLEFQSEICQGVAFRAEQLGYNVAIFASYGKYGNIHKEYEDGEVAIYDLPEYGEFAGLVLAPDTFTIPEAQEHMMQHLARIRENVTCPVVSLRGKIDGVSNILIDERNSMEGMVRHIIDRHGKKDIAFMTGPKGREDGEARLACYRRVMEEYGLPVGEHRVFYGDFWRSKGKEAYDWFSADGKYPEAIICANDYMALAVIDELYERGLRVPEDILVTGYDGTKEGMLFSPSLTSARVDFKEMAYKAVDLIDLHQSDGETETVYVTPKVVSMASCGCLDKDDTMTTARRCMLHKSEAKHDNMDLQFSFLTIDLSGVKSIGELQEVITKYVYNMEEFQDYYICLRSDIEEKNEYLRGYTEQMGVRVAIRDRKNMGEINCLFDRKELLPREFIDDAPQCYYFIPIHYLGDSYGYEVYSFRDDAKWGKTYVRWNISVSNAIYNIRFCNKMNDLIFELENMYVQDVLTGLYNRRGFEKYARMQFSQARASDSMVCVIGIDMDGLKPVNDIYGHHEGDSALRAVGYAIQEAGRSGQIGARIGGDEFDVIFPCECEEDAQSWIDVFESSLDKFNAKSGKPYEVHASIGYQIGIPTANDTIASYMKVADDRMYKNKVINKHKRNEVFR